MLFISIVATGATVMKNVKPFSRYIPNKPTSINKYAIKKYGFTHIEDEISEYVLNDIEPTSIELVKIVDHFNQLNVSSNQKLY